MSNSEYQKAKAQQEQFHQQLEAFEQNVETPLIPGEMETWIADLEESFDQLQPLLWEQLQKIHPGELNEITDEDPELFARVEELREEDQKLEQTLHKLGNQIPQIRMAISHLEPDEGRISLQIQKFMKEALQFVIRVRKQEVSIRTWLMEAFERDRGDVD